MSTTSHGNFALLILWCAGLTVTPLVLSFYEGPPWLVWLKASQPLIAVATIMGMTYGNPLNWWRPFFGTVVHVDRQRVIVREQAGENAMDVLLEIQDWLRESCRGRYVQVNSYAYKFLRKGDAMFFKLAWG